MSEAELRNRKATSEGEGEAADPTAKDDAPKEPGAVDGALTTLVAILKSLAATFFSTDASTALNRSAIFLIFFLVVHMLGNLLIFVGPEVFNTYGYFLHINPALKFIEAYLALGFVFHAVSGCFKTYKKAKSIAKSPLTQGRLLISSLVVTFFVVIHLKTFKFGAYYKHVAAGGLYIPLKGSVAKGTEMRDIYKLALEVFADPVKTWVYIISISVLGLHMWWGWEKTIKNNYSKMGLKKEYQKAAILFGHVVCVLMTAGFISSPIYVHFFLLPKLGAQSA
jgi:succinate dehydrogenase / fumarate reductase cytochrome b subunit